MFLVTVVCAFQALLISHRSSSYKYKGLLFIFVEGGMVQSLENLGH